MDFDFTKEQKDIQKAAKEFAEGEFDADIALEYDKKQAFPSAILEQACKLGFIGVHFPEEYGGQGLGLIEHVLIVEAFCRQDSGIGIALALSDFGSEMILRCGTEEQKKKILPLIAQSEVMLTTAFLEESSCVAPLLTTAKLTDNEYIINGKKTFVPFGGLAKYMIVPCQININDPFTQSTILLENELNCTKVITLGEKLGMRMIPVDRVSFTNLRVPRENRIGQEEKGFFQLRDFFNEMMIEIGAMGVGIAQGALDRALEYSKERQTFGTAIVNHNAIRNKLVDMYSEIEMARLIVYKAAWSFDSGKPDDRLILMSKMISGRTAYRVTYDALQIYGGYGYMKEGHIERFYRDAKALDLFLESPQAQRNMLADKITGTNGKVAMNCDR